MDASRHTTTGDVYHSEAPLGQVAQLGPERVALAQRLIALRGKQGVLDNGFLKFLLQADEVQEQLRARASGTTVLGVKQRELRKVLLTLPPIEEQRAIAQILGTLDDKIELNRRMSETLEAIARALFKSWFVDFDPVRAKADGRHPHLSTDTSALFPSGCYTSAIGDVPLGWQIKPLGDLFTLDKGISYKGQYLGLGGAQMVNLGCLPGAGRFDEKALKTYSGEFRQKHVIQSGDLRTGQH